VARPAWVVATAIDRSSSSSSSSSMQRPPSSAQQHGAAPCSRRSYIARVIGRMHRWRRVVAPPRPPTKCKGRGRGASSMTASSQSAGRAQAAAPARIDRAPNSGLLAGSFQQWPNSACWLAQPKPIRAHDRSGPVTKAAIVRSYMYRTLLIKVACGEHGGSTLQKTGR
jgi:hypothetical protein